MTVHEGVRSFTACAKSHQEHLANPLPQRLPTWVPESLQQPLLGLGPQRTLKCAQHVSRNLHLDCTRLQHTDDLVVFLWLPSYMSEGPKLSALAAACAGPAVVLPLHVRHVAPRVPTASRALDSSSTPVLPLPALGLRWCFRCSNPVIPRLPLVG